MKAHDGDLVGQARCTRIEAGKLAVKRHVVQGFFHGRVGQARTLLEKMNGSMVSTRNGGLPPLVVLA